MNARVKNLISQNTQKPMISDQFIEIMEMPDEKFDIIANKFITQINAVYDKAETRNEIINQLKMSPPIELENEKKGTEQLLKDIQEDNTLSENKKKVLITMLNRSIEIIESIVNIPREMVDIKIKKLREDAIIPTYAHTSDAGADIYAIEDVDIPPHKTIIVKTGIAVSIPNNYEIQIRPRSGLSSKTNLRIANTPGTIDAGYTGEVGVIMDNTGNLTAHIKKGDKIAQMVPMPVPMINWIEVDELDSTDRGTNGYGSSDEQ